MQLATTRYTRTSHLVLGCSLSGTLQFSPQNPIFVPVDPKFDPKTCVLVYILLKEIKGITNIKSKHQFTSYSSFRSFFNKTQNFSNFIQNSQTTTSIQTPSSYKYKQTFMKWIWTCFNNNHSSIHATHLNKQKSSKPLINNNNYEL